MCTNAHCEGGDCEITVDCTDETSVSNGKMFIEVDGTTMIQTRANAAGVVNARAKFVKQAGK